MGARDDTTQLLAAVARLVGPPVRKARHAHFFRIVVTSSDGKKCAVPLMVSSHRPKGRVLGSVMNSIADALLVDHADIDTVLDTWTPQQLTEHLQKHTQEQLKPRAMRK